MAYEQVAGHFNTANTYASQATARADSFIANLNAAVASMTMPTLEVNVAVPTAPVVPGALAFNVSLPGSSFPTDPGVTMPSAPIIDLAATNAPTAPALRDFSYSPTAPDAPGAAPELNNVALPAAPAGWTPPTDPELLNFAVRAFEGVNSHEGFLAQITAPGDLTLAAPALFVAPAEQGYSSEFMSALQALLKGRLLGGSGIAPEVEQKIWDRGRARLSEAANANIAEVLQNAEARGFAMPPGAVMAQIREAQKTALDKQAELTLDIAIKQADLEQANVKHAIEQGVQLESQLLQHANNMEQRAFEAARYLAQNAVEVYNSLVTQYRAGLEKYNTMVGAYKTMVDAERAKIENYRAEIEAESLKATINKTMIEEYRAQIEARTAVVALYGQELEAAKVHMDFERLRLSAYSERVQAYVAEVNAEGAKAEVFKAQLQSNQQLVDQYRAEVEAYSTRMEVASTQARTRADVYDAQMRGYASAVQAYASRVSAESERVRTLAGVEQLRLEGAKTQADQNIAVVGLQIENYKAQVGQYDALKSLALQQTKIVSDNYMALKSMVADAAKVGAQVNAQLAASAYGTIQANASVSGSDSTSTQFSYSGKTSDTRAAPILT